MIDAVRKESYLTFRNNMGTPKVIATLSFFSSKDIVWKFDWINLYIYLISLFLIFFFLFFSRWTYNDPLRAKYNAKMAGMNAPIAKPKGSKKLKDPETQ